MSTEHESSVKRKAENDQETEDDTKKPRLDTDDVHYYYRVVIALSPGAMYMYETFHLKNREEVQDLVEILLESEAAFDFLTYGLSVELSIGDTDNPDINPNNRGTDLLIGLRLKLSSRSRKAVTISPWEEGVVSSPTVLPLRDSYVLTSDKNWHCGHRGRWGKKHKDGLHCRLMSMHNRGFGHIEYPENYWNRLGGALPGSAIGETNEHYGHVGTSVPSDKKMGRGWRNFVFISALW